MLDAPVVVLTERRARAHALARARRCADIAREKLAVVRARRDARARRRRRPRSTLAGAGRRARRVVRPRAAWTSPLPRLPADELRGRARRPPQALLAARARRRPAGARAAAHAQVPGRLQLVAERAADHPRRRPQPVRDGRARRGAARRGRRIARSWRVVSILDDKDAAGMLRALLPRCARRGVHAPRATRARCRPRRSRRWPRSSAGRPPRSSRDPRGGAGARARARRAGRAPCSPPARSTWSPTCSAARRERRVSAL